MGNDACRYPEIFVIKLRDPAMEYRLHFIPAGFPDPASRCREYFKMKRAFEQYIVLRNSLS
jgi:hypothetical protein